MKAKPPLPVVRASAAASRVSRFARRSSPPAQLSYKQARRMRQMDEDIHCSWLNALRSMPMEDAFFFCETREEIDYVLRFCKRGRSK